MADCSRARGWGGTDSVRDRKSVLHLCPWLAVGLRCEDLFWPWLKCTIMTQQFGIWRIQGLHMLVLPALTSQSAVWESVPGLAIGGSLA